jgi:hypothetical protein
MIDTGREWLDTEQEWLDCVDLGLMLWFVNERISARQKRLLACACCRRIWHLLADPRSRQAVEAAEDFADGAIGTEALREAHEEACLAWERASAGAKDGNYRAYLHRCNGGHLLDDRAVFRPLVPNRAAQAESWAGSLACGAAVSAADESPEPLDPADVAADGIAYAEAARHIIPEEQPEPLGQPGFRAHWQRRMEEESRAQCVALRDIFGNPFHPVTAEAAWRTPAVVALARSVYAERRFEELPVLAAALEEARADDAELLAHLRGPGPHMSGCWALDLVLGKS